MSNADDVIMLIAGSYAKMRQILSDNICTLSHLSASTVHYLYRICTFIFSPSECIHKVFMRGWINLIPECLAITTCIVAVNMHRKPGQRSCLRPRQPHYKPWRPPFRYIVFIAAIHIIFLYNALKGANDLTINSTDRHPAAHWKH